MYVGNARYTRPEDLPSCVPVFPLSGALLLPGGQLPLNIFEPRYLAMFDTALASHRIIGMVQPAFGSKADDEGAGSLAPVGCMGRITSISETGDGRYIVSLTGICRFRLLEEDPAAARPYRSFQHAPFIADLSPQDEEEAAVDRDELLRVFRAWLDANRMEADWDSIGRAGNRTLVNSLSMMSPFGPAEKQALLEAPDLRARAETLIAMTEILLVHGASDSGTVLQ